MDIDNQNRKYAQSSHNQHYHQGSSSSSKPYESRGSRSGRGNSEFNMDNEQPRRGSSARHPSSSRGTSSRSSRYTSGSSSQQPPQQGGSGYHQSHHHYQQSSRQPQSQQGPTNAPPTSMITPNNNNHHFTPPQSSYGQQSRHGQEGSSTQPTYPPPAVTSESPPPNESSSSQRRPAYLLHRDLVIGKGSYGQVCIASRGEAEGHLSSSSNRSGKRKKFACKCVMLRNDPKYISKLQEEVNVLRELRGHDNVIRLYDVFCVDNELFIITELGRGGDLFHLLTTHPKHGVTEAYAGKYNHCLYVFWIYIITITRITILTFYFLFSICFNRNYSQDSIGNALGRRLFALAKYLPSRSQTRELGLGIWKGCLESAETH